MLDAETLSEWVDSRTLEGIRRLPPAQRSDAVRLELLSTHGGVWADATTWCFWPLDTWLGAQMDGGFFAFRAPARGFVMSSWFLASEPGNPLVTALQKALIPYWTDHEFHLGYPARAMRRGLQTLLGRQVETTRHWFSPLIQDRLRLTPYFAFHYMFAQVVANDEAAGEVWRRAGRLSADGPHALQSAGLLSPLTITTRAMVDEPVAPLYKLSWRIPSGRVPAGTTLEYLLNSSLNLGAE